MKKTVFLAAMLLGILTSAQEFPKMDTFTLVPINAPVSPNEGQTYYDQTSKKVFVWDGTQWLDLAITDTDNQTASEVSVTAIPSNYSAATQDVEAHLAGIDTALGAVGGGSGSGLTTEQAEIISNRFKTHRDTISNPTLTLSNSHFYPGTPNRGAKYVNVFDTNATITVDASVINENTTAFFQAEDGVTLTFQAEVGTFFDVDGLGRTQGFTSDGQYELALEPISITLIKVYQAIPTAYVPTSGNPVPLASNPNPDLIVNSGLSFTNNQNSLPAFDPGFGNGALGATASVVAETSHNYAGVNYVIRVNSDTGGATNRVVFDLNPPAGTFDYVVAYRQVSGGGSGRFRLTGGVSASVDNQGLNSSTWTTVSGSATFTGASVDLTCYASSGAVVEYLITIKERE